MLLHDAALSYLHFFFAFILAGALAAEALLLRVPVDSRVARLLLRVDLIYGLCAVGVILAGISRVLWGAKGWAYYSDQPFFWAKMATFIAIGLISIVPTRRIMRWVKAGADYAVPEAEARAMQRLIVFELGLLALLPLFAALMARDIGG